MKFTIELTVRLESRKMGCMRSILFFALLVLTTFGGTVPTYPFLIVGGETYRNAQLIEMIGDVVVVRHSKGVVRLKRADIPPLVLADFERVWTGLKEDAEKSRALQKEAEQRKAEAVESERNAMRYAEYRFQLGGPYKDERFARVQIGAYATDCLLRKAPAHLEKGDIFVAKCIDLGSMELAGQRYLVFQIAEVIRKETTTKAQ